MTKKKKKTLNIPLEADFFDYIHKQILLFSQKNKYA